jgi:hypothetical protein
MSKLPLMVLTTPVTFVSVFMACNVSIGISPGYSRAPTGSVKIGVEQVVVAVGSSAVKTFSKQSFRMLHTLAAAKGGVLVSFSSQG